MLQEFVMDRMVGRHASGVCDGQSGWLTCFRSLWWTEQSADMLQVFVMDRKLVDMLQVVVVYTIYNIGST